MQEQLFADAEGLSAEREQKEPEPVLMQTEEARSDDNLWKTQEQPQRQAAGQPKEGTEESKERNQEQKHGWLSLFDGKKRKNKEQREILRQQSHYAMQGSAVAEETLYNAEEEYGATVCLEMPESMQERIRGLYLPDGTLLCSLDRPVITIGTMKEESEIVLEDSSISRMHCRIVKEKEYYDLEDLNSTNGTFKNGVRLQPCEKRRLEEGDDIRCGRVLFVFR